MESKIKVITHSGTFHADEILAVAALEIYFNGKPYEVIRTRDMSVITQGDYVVDVGMIYDPQSNRFDHHQEGGAGTRENGIPYSSFGLVWKKFGVEITGSLEVAEAIDRRICWPIDMGDNGILPYETTDYGVHPYLLHSIVSAFRPTWKEEDMQDERFAELVVFCKRLLEREIKVEQDRIEGAQNVLHAYHHAEDKRLVVIDHVYPWKEVLAALPEPLYIVKPKQQQTGWEVECVRTDVFGFGNRKDLPAEWAGKEGKELAQITGVDDAVFCHNKRYVIVTRTKEGAVALARMALNT